MKKSLRGSEERIEELEELYVVTRDQFLKEFDHIRPDQRAKTLQQLRGMLDDIAKEAGGRVKRQEINNTFGHDNSFMELIAGIRGKLPEPQPVIDIAPLKVETADVEEETTGTARAE